jgi:hypothetical protein
MGQKATTVSLAESATLFTMASVDFLNQYPLLLCETKSEVPSHLACSAPQRRCLCSSYFRSAPSQQQNEAMCAYNRAAEFMVTRFGAVISDHHMLQIKPHDGILHPVRLQRFK